MYRYFTIDVDNNLTEECVEGNPIPAISAAVGNSPYVVPFFEYGLLPRGWLIMNDNSSLIKDGARVNILATLLSGFTPPEYPLAGTCCIFYGVMTSDGCLQVTDSGELLYLRMKRWLSGLQEITQEYITEHGPSELIPEPEIHFIKLDPDTRSH